MLPLHQVLAASFLLCYIFFEVLVVSIVYQPFNLLYISTANVALIQIKEKASQCVSDMERL